MTDRPPRRSPTDSIEVAALMGALDRDGVGMAMIEGGRVRYASASLAALLRRDVSELIDAPVGDVLAPLEADGSSPLLDLATAGGSEVQLRRGDGSWVWVRLAEAIQFVEGRRPPCFVVVVVDLSERKAAEEQLTELPARERERIGQMLHDSVGQTLTGVSMLVGDLAFRLAARDAPEAELAHSIGRHIRELQREVRRATRALVPPALGQRGLDDALRALVDQMNRYGGPVCCFESDTIPAIDQGVAQHLFRIGQEALHNAQRHADASSVVVSLRTGQDGALTLMVCDNGFGRKKHAERGSGLGILIMHQRAAQIGAKLAVGATPMQGFQVCCDVPAAALSGQHAERGVD